MNSATFQPFVMIRSELNPKKKPEYLKVFFLFYVSAEVKPAVVMALAVTKTIRNVMENMTA